MTRRDAIFLITASLPASAQKKGPDLDLIEAAAHVEDNRINIDIRIRNLTNRSIRKITVIFEILDTSGSVLSKQQGQIEESVLEPQEVGNFHAQMAWHARTHAFRVSFEDANGRELRTEDTGPRPVE